MEHWFVASYEMCESPMHSIFQGYPCFIGLLHEEGDGLLEVNFVNVATSVTGSVRLVSLLWHHGTPLAIAEQTLWLRRWLL